MNGPPNPAVAASTSRGARKLGALERQRQAAFREGLTTQSNAKGLWLDY